MPGFAPIANNQQLSGLGFAFLLAFIFVSTSRVLDFQLNSLHIPLICSVLAAVFTLLGGALRTAFQSRIGKLMVLFGVWMVICVPFSDWRGGSYSVLVGTFFKSFLVFVMVAGSTTTLARVRKMVITIALGAFVAMAIANVMQAKIDGRLTMPTGFLANPNDLAQVMLVGVCFMPVWGVGKSPQVRGFVALLMLPFVYTVFETGSRAALLALIALAILVFLYASPMRKVFLTVLFLAAGIGLFSASDTARMRLATLFSDKTGDKSASQEIAIESRDGRLKALNQSLELTLKNPLFGVGPGVFASSAADMSHAEGKRAAWVETHNSYTQVSSEMGIPGLIFFGGAVLSCLLGLSRVRKIANTRPDKVAVAGTANFMLAGFWTFAFVALFVSVAYQFYFSLMIGMAAAAISVMERELRVPVSAPHTGQRNTPPGPPIPVTPPISPRPRTRLRG